MRKKLKEKVSISQNIFIDFERGIIYQDNDDSNIIKLTPNEVKIIKLLCTRNNKYVINQEILEYIYGKNNDNIALITRTMSKLRSKQTNKIMLYDIIISDGRGRFKICLTESPFEDSELEGNNPIADYIETYHLPRFNLSPLKYDAENTTFCGRKNEMEQLIRFLNDNKPFLWWAVTGKGGSGKSRLAYELMKTLNSHKNISLEDNWKAVMIEWSSFYSQVKKFFDLTKWTDCKHHYLIIIDYVQSFEKEIADFLQFMARISWNTKKVRVLLLERAPKLQDESKTQYEPLWYRTFKASWKNVDWLNGTCYSQQFINLQGIDESSAIEIMQSYISSNGKIVHEDTCNILIDYVKKISQQGIIPLLLLCVTQTWLDSPSKFNKPEYISKSNIWNQIIEKEKKDITIDSNQMISNALLEIHSIACIIHRLDLELIEELFSLNRFCRYQYQKKEIIGKLFESKYVINHDYKEYLLAIEPDIIGEYFVYGILQTYTKSEYEQLFDWLYKKSGKEVERFFWRYSCDFNFLVTKHPGYQFLTTLILSPLKEQVKEEIIKGEAVSDKDEWKFTVTDDNGKVVQCEILFTFEEESTGKDYIVYTDDTLDENGNLKVYASIQSLQKDGTIKLLPIETDVEWRMIETILTGIKESSPDL